ncbi:unnamed protein product [Acanthoscelides obtectus]|uniref:Tick transposon n=1 Tax=Acanthoscelides obtectus TaxID=200917 RepID=A0A9P0P8D0_ACAOB|nr:unnamed protein product [Acanthoscelides obtectus]CAK1681670.1 hypothetical protein AOBTE_LOCUS33202 [Acanthoscelides obtectus]
MKNKKIYIDWERLPAYEDLTVSRDGIRANFSKCQLSISRASLDRLTFERDGVLNGITCVYRPPPISKKDFTHDLHTYLEHNSSANTEIFLGDININILDSKDTLKFLNDCDWNLVTSVNDPEIAVKLLLTTYRDLLLKATETIPTRVSIPKKIKPWISNGIIVSVKKREKRKKRLLANYSLSLENQYKDYRNKLNKLIHKQKNNYYRMQIEKNKNNMKQLYDVINDAPYEKSYKGQSYISINDNDGNQFTASIEMVNFCNEYFIDVGVNMARTIPTPESECKLAHPVQNSIFLSPITRNELIKHIASLKSTSAPG